MVSAVPINTAAKLNLLQIVQTACQEIAIPVPISVVGNTDPQIIQLLALANREGREFSQLPNKNGGWEELRQQYLFSTQGVQGITGTVTSGSAVITGMSSTVGIVAGYVATGNGIPSQALVVSVDSSTQVTIDSSATSTSSGVSLTFGKQSYDLPSDFGYFINKTFWDRSYRWQLLGPLEAQEWQVLKSGISPTGPRSRFRIMGNLFYVDPVPASVRTLVYEYYSTGWCQSVAGVAQSLFAADTDYYSLDDDALILGIILRYLKAKRFSYDTDEMSYGRHVERLLARNGGNRDLPLNATASGINFLGNANIPDTGFGQ